MKIDLSFWRFVIIIAFAKSWLWGKGNDVYFFHIGTFTDGKSTAMKIIALPISICFGIARCDKQKD